MNVPIGNTVMKDPCMALDTMKRNTPPMPLPSATIIILLNTAAKLHKNSLAKNVLY